MTAKEPRSAKEGHAAGSGMFRFFRERPAHEKILWDRRTSIIWHPSEVETQWVEDHAGATRAGNITTCA